MPDEGELYRHPKMLIIVCMPDPIKRWRPAAPRGIRPAKEQHHYRTADWRARRVRILVRDAYRCRLCSTVVAGQAAHVDHRIAIEDSGTDADENLWTLCNRCHGAKTIEEQRRRGMIP